MAWLWEGYHRRIVRRLSEFRTPDDQSIPVVVDGEIRVGSVMDLLNAEVLPPTEAGWIRFTTGKTKLPFRELIQIGRFWFERDVPRGSRAKEDEPD